MKIEEKVFRREAKQWLEKAMMVELVRIGNYRAATPSDVQLLEHGKQAAEVLESLARTYTMLSRRGML